ncbi:MAG: YbdK family carboxylate-amine ligase, partial [Planctomycetaceae bacterium]|nr:YbdK family carboxylate-amine ligase [Planctomycetaceae bacterium]
MPPLVFTRNDAPTLGVEVELQLVDAKSFELRSAIADIMERLPADLEPHVKPELMQCYLEINTGVCRDVGDVRRDLQRTLGKLQTVTDALGLRLYWAATHPVSSWREQLVTVNERYYRLVELMQDVSRQLVTYGLHVHVGVESGDKAVMICDRMLRHLPLLLALTANSPFWEGRPTGLMSNRSKIMEMLPTAGLPLQMRNWSEYTWLVNHLVDTGFIHTIREIWWDIRPHHNFGTVEIRVCDLPPNLDHVLAITALVQSLVVAISREIDEGTYQSEYHPMMVAQNKWRATRFGADARLVNTDDYKPYGVQELLDRLVTVLRPVSKELRCADELESCRSLPKQSGAAEQLRIHAETHSRHAVVQRM